MNIKVSYHPDNCLRQGRIGIVKEIFREVIANRWLTIQILKRDMFAMYKQSIAGLLWLLINPIAIVATYMILSKSQVFNIGKTGAPYPIYAILGMSVWQLFAVGLVTSANSLVNAGSMISKINFSKKSLIIASVGSSILSFLIQFVLALVLCIVYRVVPSPCILLLPILVIPMMLLSLGVGFMAALLNAVARDFGAAIPVLTSFFLMLTPVLYSPKSSLIAVMARYNVLYYLTSVPREIALTGHTHHLLGYGISAVISALVLMVCITIFHLTESRIAERI
ncbi:ABC transporter permease [bacterium]|nr:ABC transporter permease [bacterium]